MAPSRAARFTRRPGLTQIKLAIGKIHILSAEQLRRGVNEAGLNGRWDIGHLLIDLSERGALPSDYGDAKIHKLSEALRLDYGRGFAPRSLWYMTQFAKSFERDELDYRLSWTIYRLLLSVDDPKRRAYFRRISVDRNLTSFELESLLRHENPRDSEAISQRLKRPDGQLYTYELKTELGG